MGEEGSGVGEKDTCCFTGHRPSKLPWGTREEDPRCVALKGRIAAALEEEYAAGVRHFIWRRSTPPGSGTSSPEWPGGPTCTLPRRCWR